MDIKQFLKRYFALYLMLFFSYGLLGIIIGGETHFQGNVIILAVTVLFLNYQYYDINKRKLTSSEIMYLIPRMLGFDVLILVINMLIQHPDKLSTNWFYVAVLVTSVVHAMVLFCALKITLNKKRASNKTT